MASRPVVVVEIHQRLFSIREKLHEPIRWAETFGIELLLEPHGILTDTADGTPRILDALGHEDTLGINLDTGNSWLGGGDPLQFVKTFGPRIKHVHWKDMPAGMLPHRGTRFGCGMGLIALGDGIVGIEAIVKELLASGFDGPTTLEIAGGIKTHFMSDDIAKPIVDTYRKNWEADGTTFFGPKGWVSLSRGGYAASNPEWFREQQKQGAIRVPYQKNFYAAFVDAVRDHTPGIAPIGDAVRSDTLSHLSVLAIQSGREIVWDPKLYQIQSPAELNSKMSHQIRGPWRQS